MYMHVCLYVHEMVIRAAWHRGGVLCSKVEASGLRGCHTVWGEAGGVVNHARCVDMEMLTHTHTHPSPQTETDLEKYEETQLKAHHSARRRICSRKSPVVS